MAGIVPLLASLVVFWFNSECIAAGHSEGALLGCGSEREGSIPDRPASDSELGQAESAPTPGSCAARDTSSVG